ncbi:hypothetical protein D9M70_548790 [compost metagenome]
MVAHFLVRLANPNPRRVQFDHQLGHTLAINTEQHHKIGDRCIADEALAAIDDVTHLGARGQGAHGFDTEVGTGIRFGSGKAADLVAVEQGREIALLDRVRAVLQRIAGENAMHVDDGGHRVRMVGQFFDHHCGGGGWVLEPAPADFGSEGNAEQPGRGHFGE